MRRRTIRRRLVVTIGAGCLVVLTLIAFASITAVRSQLTGRLDDELLASAANAQATAEVLTAEQSTRLRSAANPGTYSVVVALPTGSIVWTSATGSTDADGAALTAIPYDELVGRAGEPFTVSVPDRPSQRALATQMDSGAVVVFARSLDGITSTVNDLTLWLAAICGLGLAVLLVLVALSGRSVVRPLERMVPAAERIGAGDFAHRIDEDQPDLDTRRLARALNTMLEQLSVAFAAKETSETRLRRFLADASHELRTPLTTIRAHAELAGGPVPEAAKDRSIEKIEAETRRMSQLVDDLFLLARLDMGRALDVAVVDLGAVVTEAVDALRVVQPERPVDVHLPEGDVEVPGDAGRLRQAVDNLLGNVRDHTAPTDPLVVRLTADDRWAHLAVRDHGPGLGDLPPEAAFERFHRGPPSSVDDRGGAGLGLSIVASVVAGHGGSTSISDAHPGVEVTLDLPRTARKSEPDAPQAAARASR